MHYHALAVDYDGTLATHGHVEEPTLDALRRVKESGRRIVLVTGRCLEPLLEAFPGIGLCDLVVAENGALIYDPKTREERPLGEPPPPQFLQRLAERGVPQLEIGRVIVATWTPHETVTFETIRDLRLELQIIFNKGAVMVLPTGINKASGLRFALAHLGISHHNTIGVGDAENDEAFLRLCDCGVAVENALLALKERADLVTAGARGAGVIEDVERLLDDDLKSLRRRLDRGILLGYDLAGNDFRVPVYGVRALVIGEPAGGKSTFAHSLIAQLMELEYQTCIVDPEGDYQKLEDAIVLGTREQSPAPEEVIQVLERPTENCVASLFATDKKEHAALFDGLLRALQEFRSRAGRPHWIVVDEAHYPLPAKWQPAEDLHFDRIGGIMLITAYPDRLPRFVLEAIDLVVAIGEEPRESLGRFCQAVNSATPQIAAPEDHQEHRALAWWRGREDPKWIRRLPAKGEHQRHQHTYLDGDMAPDLRFYFRGPMGELNIPAQNLRLFMQLGEGIDDATWMFHLRQGDYARWFRDVIHDDELAGLAERLQQDGQASPQGSRESVFELIRKLYMPEEPKGDRDELQAAQQRRYG